MLGKPLLTTHETADFLKVSAATVRNLIRDGDIRAILFVRSWRIAVNDLEALLNARANRAPDPAGPGQPT
jgi:excisionase family DNA binding protein